MVCRVVRFLVFACALVPYVTGVAQYHEHELYFNADSAAFINLAYPTSSGYSGEGKVIQAWLGDPDHRLYLTTLSDSTVRWKTNYGGGRAQGIWSILADPYPRINWRNTGASRLNNLGQSCLEAKGSHGGRDYTAWYVPSVPTPFGPWMLHGLPGLVDELTSADSMLHVQLTSLAPTRESIPTFTDGTPRTYPELRRQVIEHLIVIEEIGVKYNASVTYRDPCSNCEIELNKWHYIRDYKIAEAKAKRRKLTEADGISQ